MRRFLIVFVVFFALVEKTNSQPPIVLRDLSILKNRTIASFDMNGAVLDDGNKLSWDQIYEAKVDDPDFEKLHSAIATPLFQLKQRVAAGDIVGAMIPSRKLQAIFKAQPTSPTFGLASATLLAGSLQEAKREIAVFHWRQVIKSGILKLKQEDNPFAKTVARLDLQIDEKSGFCSQLLPLFFSRENAKASLNKLGPVEDGQLEAYYVFVAALAETAIDPEHRTKALALLEREYPQSHWYQVFSRAKWSATSTRPPFSSTPMQQHIWTVKQFKLADSLISQSSTSKQKRGAIKFIAIAAYRGNENPELAAASLHRVAQWYQSQKHDFHMQTIHREILDRFPATEFGIKLVKQLGERP